MNPVTKYTKSGNINIAYQVFGTGNKDLVYVPGWVSNIDRMWSCPALVDFFKELSKTVRIIIFDKRGTGLSDREIKFSTLEERMEDITAVMDAANSKKAILFGQSEGGSLSALYSATYPNRVLSLIGFGVFAKRKNTPNYPWAPTEEEQQRVYDMIQNNWCSGEMLLKKLAPSKTNDEKFLDWLTSYFRSGASPNAAMRLTKMNSELDITGVLEHIKTPTLLLHRTNDNDVKVEEGKFIAQQIKKSKFIELEGKDHLFWAGNTREILHEIQSFITNVKPTNSFKKGFTTVLFGQLVASYNKTITLDLIAPLIKKFNGEVILLESKSFTITFETPGKAVNCSIALFNALQKEKISLAMGAYIKEETKNADQFFNDKDFYMKKTMLSQLRVNQILVTQTVKHLLPGVGNNFLHNTSILNYNANTLCKLYNVNLKTIGKNEISQNKTPLFSNHDSFLESVLQIINENIKNDTFNVETLSDKMRMSERKLQRKVKATTNRSPYQLISSVRLNNARDVLTSSNLTITEIAFKFGFSSPSYFTKCFKKEFNMNPTTLLQRA